MNVKLLCFSLTQQQILAGFLSFGRFASLFNADLALSVSMTAMSTILSSIALPGNLLLYAKFAYQGDGDLVANLQWNALFVAMTIVIAGISTGIFCSAWIRSRKFNRLANRLGNVAGLCLIVFSATLTNMGSSSDTRIYARHWTFYVAVAAPCLFGLILATVLASLFQLKPPERITIGIECCYQNVGIATSLALTMFEGDALHEAMGVRKCRISRKLVLFKFLT